MPELSVQKKGNTYTAYVGEDGRPISASSPEGQPPGGLAQVFVGERELKARFPGYDLTFLEKPTKPPVVITRSKEVKDEAAKIMAKASAGAEQAAVARVSAPPPSMQTVTGGRERAEEFLKRIEYAARYASEEHAITLAIQIDTVEDLIKEVWGE